MTSADLTAAIRAKRSFLCLGLDPDPRRLPACLAGEPDPVLAFNHAIIAATHDLCVAYKPNTAFYEAQGAAGWRTLEATAKLIPADCFRIADAKRGDIGNTSALYARAFFDALPFDAVTVAPYMGQDSVAPFLENRPGKWAILLALTSNPGADDFQTSRLNTGEELFERVLTQSQRWLHADQLMYVVGATRAKALQRVRHLVPHAWLLVPGVGAQGGSLADVARYGMTPAVGLLVNSSREILYASSGEDFAEAARTAALRVQAQMADLLTAVGL
ncbi:MAG: orotidine-5'-phosphate decarboxylase [Hymenobacteraceae bacterium]|nr:orotidine-5'-phosphate decarboxylase [Hymenobacteraceae bacterium]